MIITGLYLKNFGPFHGEHTILLKKSAPGLYYVGGRNEVEPDISPNGVGKSLVWEAWDWCWFGRTPRNLRGNDIRPWNSKGLESVVRVRFQFHSDGPIFGVSRTVGKAGVRWDDGSRSTWEELDQHEVERRLGCTSTEFEHSILMGQETPLFFDLPPTPKMAIVQDILDLGAWEGWSKQASQEAVQVDQIIRRVEKDVVAWQTRKETSQEELRRVRKEAQSWEAQRTERLQAIKGRIYEGRDAQAGIEQQLQALPSDSQESLEKVQQEIDALCGQHQESADQLEQAKSRLQDIQRDGESYHREARSIQQLDTQASCPTCRQGIGSVHVKKCMNELKRLLAKTETARKLAQQALRHPQQLCDSLAKKIADKEDVLQAYQQKLATVERKRRDLEGQQHTASAILEELVQQETAILDERNMYQDQATQCEQNVAEAEEHLQQVTVMLQEQQTAYRATEYWIKGFKQIRLGLIDEALHLLEAEVNTALVDLGLVGWRIGFDVERETKSGGISKGFTVLVYPPSMDRPVVWESYSGGEKQRLRLAGRLGIASLIASRKGFMASIEVWDEPTQHLGQSGIDALVQVLQERARRYQRQIYLIDHRALDLSGFVGEWTVVKDAQGSYVYM